MAEKKYLYCNAGKHYPEDISEVYDSCTHERTWFNGDYEIKEETMGESLLFCTEHGCRLEEKEQVDDKDSILPPHEQSLPVRPAPPTEEKRDEGLS